MALNGDTGASKEPVHLSVLAEQAIALLDCSPGGIVVDATLGGGGHAELMLQRVGRTGRLIGMDCDDYAIERAGRRLGSGPNVVLVRENFRNIKEVLEQESPSGADAIMFDLGLSSFHIDEASRGFSFSRDARLDMRMDRRSEWTAEDIVNEYSERELADILKQFGEERHARRIAKAMVRERSKKRIRTTAELADIVRRSKPRPKKRTRIDPATKTFQALRIEVNSELDSLRQALDDAISLLRPRGRICVISFHSLEDRIVKKTFARLARGCDCPPEFPVCVCGKKPILKVLTSKPVQASSEQIAANPRSISAKLRAAEKLAVEAPS